LTRELRKLRVVELFAQRFFMKKFLKYAVVSVCTFVFLLAFTIVLLPILINVQNFVPAIERQVSQATGRSFTIGSDVSISFFPWLSLSFSDLTLGNPEGFSDEGSLKIESFEGQIELLPLLVGKLKLDRFVVGGVHLRIETNADGAVNWNISEEQREEFSGVSMDLFAVTNGTITWVDKRNGGKEHKAEDFMVLANNVGLSKPFTVDARATVDGRTFAFNGEIDPFPKNDLKRVDYKLNFDFAEVIQGKLKGDLTFDPLEVHADTIIAPFVPAKVAAVFSDTKEKKDNPFFAGLGAAEMHVNVIGSRERLELLRGIARVDRSNVNFEGKYLQQEPDKLELDVNMNKVALQDYVSGASRFTEESYDLLKEFLLATEVHIKVTCKEFKVQEAMFNNFEATLVGKDGILDFTPVKFSVYGGKATAKSRINLKGDVPETRFAVTFNDADIARLFSGLFNQDLFGGKGSLDGSFGFSGHTRKEAVSTLTGKVVMSAENGSLAGFDLNDIYSGGKSQFVGFAPGVVHDVRTSFDSLKMTWTASNGVFELSDSNIDLPGITATVSGSADLNNNRLNLQFVDPQATGDATDSGAQLAITETVRLSGALEAPQLLIGQTVIPQNGVLVAKAVEVDNLLSEKVPMPADEDVKDSVGRTLIDPLVIAERMGFAPTSAKHLSVLDRPTVSISKIRIRPLREELTM